MHTAPVNRTGSLSFEILKSQILHIDYLDELFCYFTFIVAK